MKSACVFCGSGLGIDPGFALAARELGAHLAEQEIELIYGGSKDGLMGTVANGALEKGGRVIGVLPKFLQAKEVAHPGLTELILCESMHERKQIMFERSEGFIAMPGGFGTLEEVVEILTWRQLSLHRRPIGFLNVNGFYDHLRAFFDVMEQAQLLKSANRKFAQFHDVPTRLVLAMQTRTESSL